VAKKAGHPTASLNVTLCCLGLSGTVDVGPRPSLIPALLLLHPRPHQPGARKSRRAARGKMNWQPNRHSPCIRTDWRGWTNGKLRRVDTVIASHRAPASRSPCQRNSRAATSKEARNADDTGPRPFGAHGRGAGSWIEGTRSTPAAVGFPTSGALRRPRSTPVGPIRGAVGSGRLFPAWRGRCQKCSCRELIADPRPRHSTCRRNPHAPTISSRIAPGRRPRATALNLARLLCCREP
jgi:hypothetical protein